VTVAEETLPTRNNMSDCRLCEWKGKKDEHHKCDVCAKRMCQCLVTTLLKAAMVYGDTDYNEPGYVDDMVALNARTRCYGEDEELKYIIKIEVLLSKDKTQSLSYINLKKYINQMKGIINTTKALTYQEVQDTRNYITKLETISKLTEDFIKATKNHTARKERFYKGFGSLSANPNTDAKFIEGNRAIRKLWKKLRECSSLERKQIFNRKFNGQTLNTDQAEKLANKKEYTNKLLDAFAGISSICQLYGEWIESFDDMCHTKIALDDHYFEQKRLTNLAEKKAASDKMPMTELRPLTTTACNVTPTVLYDNNGEGH